MLKIPRHIYETIITEAKAKAPIEACGYLAGKDGLAHENIIMTNVDNAEEHFSFDPKEQFGAVKSARAKGLGLIAVWHSHPVTPARMSEEDKRLAADPATVYVIYSIVNDDLKGFKRTADGFEPVPVEIV